MRSPTFAALLLLIHVLFGCAPEVDPPPQELVTDSPAPFEAFWENLQAHCGDAYSGGLTLEPPRDDMLTGNEDLIVHFRECGAEELRLPFHIEDEETGEWDRSRTWVFIRLGDGLELRHDHREPDGSEAEATWYGGRTMDAGTANRQDFLSVERTEESGYERGWRVEVVPGERYTYGTTRRGEWSWRVDFDLRRSVPPPPAPWGHD